MSLNQRQSCEAHMLNNSEEELIMAATYELPEGWGRDSLSYFQNTAFSNEQWSFVNDTEFNALLSDCDSFIFESLIKTTPKHKDKSNIGALLFISSHNHYRASARLCLSGQYLPVFPTARATLENVMYGWYLSSHPDLIALWLNKPADKKALRTWNNTFSFSNIARLLGQQEEVLERLLKQTHQIAINFGAHPNKEALTSNLILLDDEGMYSIGYLHGQGKIIPYTCSFMLDISLSFLVLLRKTYPILAEEDNFHLKYNAIAQRVNEYQLKAHAEIERLRRADK